MKLVVSFRWYRDYHGRAAAGDTSIEWPPSPWRLLCALVSAARPASVAEIPECLRWLCRLPAPAIFTPPVGQETPEPTRSVPLDGIFDAEPFRDGPKSRQKLYKFRRDIRLEVLGSKTIHFVWEVDGSPPGSVEALDQLLAAVPYLGTSADSGAGCAYLVGSALRLPDQIEWAPGLARGVARSCPDEKALERLVAFHHRAQPQSLRIQQVAPAAVLYRERRMAGSVCEVFDFETANGGKRAFDTHQACGVAEAVRRAVLAAAGSVGASAEFLHGHHARDRDHLHVFPLPTVGHRYADGRIRRVLLYGTPRADEAAAVNMTLKELAWTQIAELQTTLAPAEERGGVVAAYLSSATTWQTVTPLVLPNPELRGRDGQLWRQRSTLEASAANRLREKLSARRFTMVARMFADAGLSPISLAVSTASSSPMLPSAGRFAITEDRAKYLQHTRCHVTAVFEEPVCGPLAIGPGRFFGLGLFAPKRAVDCETPP